MEENDPYKPPESSLTDSAEGPAGGEVAPAEYMRALGRRTASMILYGIALALNLVGLGLELSGGQDVVIDERLALTAKGSWAVVSLVVILPAFVVFLMWLYRKYKNLYALAPYAMRSTPGWAVGGWFVPFLNLVRPAQIVADIWRGTRSSRSAEADGALSPLIGLWWALWLVSSVIGQVVLRMPENRELFAAGLVAEAISHALGILLIFRIGRRQDLKARELGLA